MINCQEAHQSLKMERQICRRVFMSSIIRHSGKFQPLRLLKLPNTLSRPPFSGL